jgi:hypothetical protein
MRWRGQNRAVSRSHLADIVLALATRSNGGVRWMASPARRWSLDIRLASLQRDRVTRNIVTFGQMFRPLSASSASILLGHPLLTELSSMIEHSGFD